MASRIPMAKEGSHGGENSPQNHQGGSGSLWSNQEEMRRYVSKLKSELAEQKNRVKRVHRDKSEEIKRLQENLDNEKQKAIENVSKKLESDKTYELKKMKESVSRQKENELRQVLRVKDEEMRTLKSELQETKNTTRILELENKRIISEQSRGEPNELERRWKSEVSSLRNDKRRLEESLRIKSEADFEKAELVRKMKQEHDSEIRRLTRESKRESLKEFRQLKAVSREVELKKHQLAAKEADLRRLAREKNHLGNELNSQRRGSLKKTNSFNSQKVKGLSASQNSESDFDNVAEEKIKKLKMRNSELVAIARKLEEKAKQLQEEKYLLEKSNEVNNPEVGNLKKAFARQRAKDLAERAKLLMNKDNEINHLKKEVEETCHNGFNENGGCDEELEKIVHQTSKEHLLLEKQVSSKIESLLEEIKDVTAQNTRLTNDNDILNGQVSKLQNFESKHHTMLSEMKEMRERNRALENACSEKDKRMYNSELEKQAYTAKNNALQKKNVELLSKVDQLNKVEQECLDLKGNVHTLTNENDVMKEENAKLRKEIENLSEVKKDIKRLEQENMELENERKDVLLKLEERDNEISSLHEAQEVAQRKYSEEVSGLEDMVLRLKEQQARSEDETYPTEIQDSSSSVLTSTPKDNKCTQTSRPSSPIMSPIIHNGMQELQRDSQQDDEETSINDEDPGQNLLTVPYNGTSSSTSFDLEKAGIRIQQLAASDSDEVDCNGIAGQKNLSSMSSEISEYSEETSGAVETSYSADVSQASDIEELCPDKTLQDDQQDSDNEDPRDNPDIYIGSPLQDLPDLEEKLSIFIAKYNYDPILYSPNENSEMELAFQAGDYLYVYGDIDEDGFYVGEMMNGERGLVPSNFVERIAEDEAILKQSDEIAADDDNQSEEDSSDEEITLKDEDGRRKVIRPKAFSERRHEWFRSSLDHVLTDGLGDIRESDEDDLGASSLSEDELGNRKNRNKRSNKPEADQASSEGLDSMDSDISEPRIPSPSKLSLDRQFTNSALISWRGAQLPSDEIQGYNIYVDGKFKTQVKGNKKTNAVVEDIKPTETYRLSVRTKSVTGVESPDLEATMIFGPDAKLSPSGLRVVKITATSGQVHWLPAHSSYHHEVFLDETLLECVQPGSSSYTINDLTPDTLYQVRVRALIPDYLKLTVGKIADESLSAETEFTTSAGGLPEPPVDLRLVQRTGEYIVLTWLPVTLSQDAYSNGYKVSSYKIYVNGIYCTETVSACVDSVEISMERLRNLGRRHDFSRMRFVVRTLSVLGESVDSNIVDIGSDESGGLADVNGFSEAGLADEKYRASANSEETAMANNTNLENDSAELERESNPDLLENDVGVSSSNNETFKSEAAFSNNVTDKVNCSENLEQTSGNAGQPSEPDGKSTGSEQGELNSLGKDELDESTDVKVGVGEGVSSTSDVSAMIVRRPPIVTRYEDVETESESYSTDSKTQDTEDELIERFEPLEISEKKELSKSNVSYEDEKEMPEDDANFTAEQRSETSETKQNNSDETASGKHDSELHSSEQLDSRQVQELNSSTSEDLKEGNVESTSNVPNLELSSENKTGNDENHKADSTTETEVSRNLNSLTTEQQSESETRSGDEYKLDYTTDTGISRNTEQHSEGETDGENRDEGSQVSLTTEQQSERETRSGEEYKLDYTTDTGISRNTEQHSEGETDGENRDEGSQAKHFQVLIQNAVSKDTKNGIQGRDPTLNAGPLQSESETETEYGPPLSVIDEVDEDNLTDTNNPQRTNTTSDDEATLSNKQLKSLPADSSKSSDLAASRSRTIASDDEGFRTEDDVLDLLDDDDGIIGDSKGDEDESGVNKGERVGASRVNKGDDRISGDDGEVDNRENGVNNGNCWSNNDNKIIGDTSVEQDKNDSNTEGNCDSSSRTETPGKGNSNDSLSQTDTVSCNMQENIEARTNSHTTTDDESTENLSESTCPTRTSLKSDSSIYEEPPAADHALETIMATFSLPSNRGMASGESDHNGNMLSGSEQTSEVISGRNRAESERSENVSERYFVALYSYEPSLMSPNEDGADEELPFNEGDIIKVVGEKDDDGFYWGECKLKQGFVPSNMIAEMNINEAEDLFLQANCDVGLHNELNSRGQVNGELDVDVISDNLGREEPAASDRLSFWENLENDHLGPRKMKTLYDYDPARDSPNVDSEVELKFKAGEIIFVFGEMDDDGFFKGELDGIRGLVPSNFLQPIEEETNHDVDRTNNDDELTSKANAALSAQGRESSVSSSNHVTHVPADGDIQHKKKRNIFSKGKKIFKKAFK